MCIRLEMASLFFACLIHTAFVQFMCNVSSLFHAFIRCFIFNVWTSHTTLCSNRYNVFCSIRFICDKFTTTTEYWCANTNPKKKSQQAQKSKKSWFSRNQNLIHTHTHIMSKSFRCNCYASLSPQRGLFYYIFIKIQMFTVAP